MGNAKFRQSTGGSLKFKRSLNIVWELSLTLEESSIIGHEGELERAVVFADPLQISHEGIELSGTKFRMHSKTENIVSSVGRAHKIVHGPFFKSENGNLSEQILKLTSMGAWSPGLPKGESLNVTISNLSIDHEYEIRLTFSHGKKNGSRSIMIGPNDFEAKLSDSYVNIVIGKFVANTSVLDLKIKSTDEGQPFINSLVLRKLRFLPRTNAFIKLFERQKVID